MANTVTTDGRCITLSAIDSDYDMAYQKRILSIQFVPGAADDVITILGGSATGPIRYYDISGDGEPRIKYFFGVYMQVFLDYSECTLSANSLVIIELY